MAGKNWHIWLFVAGLAVIIEYYLLGKTFFPSYNVHKARAITFVLFGLSIWVSPKTASGHIKWFNKLGLFLLAISVNNFYDETWGDPFTISPVELKIGIASLLLLMPFELLPWRRWHERALRWWHKL
jgi:hypothetical protein